uniref:Uncharacterized protein n=1 Tax=Mycena chlorophos TaxID=658473 RepID=A0ABQ0M5J8_MYCCL|nr:predicted protein [Mycena chlorophos]
MPKLKMLVALYSAYNGAVSASEMEEVNAGTIRDVRFMAGTFPDDGDSYLDWEQSATCAAKDYWTRREIFLERKKRGQVAAEDIFTSYASLDASGRCDMGPVHRPSRQSQLIFLWSCSCIAFSRPFRAKQRMQTQSPSDHHHAPRKRERNHGSERPRRTQSMDNGQHESTTNAWPQIGNMLVPNAHDPIASSVSPRAPHCESESTSQD